MAQLASLRTPSPALSLVPAQPQAPAVGAPRPAVGLHGRKHEIEQLDAHLAALRRGRGGIVIVEGAPGTGKTRLLDETATRARRLGLRTVRGAGDPAAGAVPMAPLLEALLEREHPIADTGRLREIARLADPRFWQLRELQERLEQTALTAPLIVAIDDLQWADEATLLALRMLPRRLSAHAILWVLGVRAAFARTAASTVAGAGARTLALEPLDRSAARRIAEDVFAAPADEAILARAGEVQGHPLLLIELLRGLRDEGLATVRDGRATLVGEGLPRRFRDAVGASLAHLSDGAQRAVEIASVLGRRFTAQQLASLLEQPPARLAGLVHEAIAADILAEHGEVLGFRHELVREAVDAGLPVTIRSAVRRQAASLTLDHDARATERGRPALALAPPDAPTAAAVAGTAPYLLVAVGASGALAVEGAALLDASAAAFAQHDYAAAFAHADGARRLAGCGGDDGGLAGGSAASRLPDIWAAWARGAAGCADAALPALQEGVRSARRSGRVQEMPLWLSARCRVLLAGGRVAAARADAEAIVEGWAGTTEGASAGTQARYVLGRVAIHTGDRAGLQAAAVAAQEMRGAESTSVRRTGQWLGALIADAEGDRRRAMALLQDTVAALGSASATFAAPGDAGDLLDLLRIVLRAGDHAAAARVVEEGERRAGLNPGLPALRVLAEHGRALLTGDADGMRASVASLAALPGSLCRAQVAEDAAAVLREHGRTEAVRLLDEALSLYVELGCQRDAARVRRGLRGLGERRRRTSAAGTDGWADLTVSELSVVALVAEGATNRQAAERLFLSPHTIGSHLRHAFEKLGISSRVELARRYAERPGGGRQEAVRR